MSVAREGSSRSRCRVALAVFRKLKTLLGGGSGGMQGGPRRGRSPITGPALLHAAQASQISPDGEPSARRAARAKGSSLAGEAKSHAAQASQISPDGETPCPQGSKSQRIIPRRGGEIARRTGVQNFADRRNPVPAGQQNQKMTARRTGETTPTNTSPATQRPSPSTAELPDGKYL